MDKENGPFLSMPYFAYGSNLHLNQMKKRCPRSVPLERATLCGYTLVFRGVWQGTAVADVIPCEGSSVQGGLYRLAKADLASLDEYEDYPVLYGRTEVTVRTETMGEVRAFMYYMKGSHEPADPDEWYFAEILQGYRDWKWDEQPLYAAREKARKGKFF